MIHLQLATRNAHKAAELGKLLGAGFVLEDLATHPEVGEVVEDGATFDENARLKAIAVSRQLPGLVLADDSGLEVDSLGGAPGIRSARYAGEGATDIQNRAKLSNAVTQLPASASRRARFRCVLALARDGKCIQTFEGMVEGTIVPEARGTAGFGYDSLFQPNESDKTFAELSATEKNAISHRASAAAKLRDFLQTSRSG
ncbi:MAG TPA: RdgB/HAM1 family non-canonical purine NTP pyrophosphatase [Chthoniobacterales bacterium]